MQKLNSQAKVPLLLRASSEFSATVGEQNRSSKGVKAATLRSMKTRASFNCTVYVEQSWFQDVATTCDDKLGVSSLMAII